MAPASPRKPAGVSIDRRTLSTLSMTAVVSIGRHVSRPYTLRGTLRYQFERTSSTGHGAMLDVAEEAA